MVPFITTLTEKKLLGLRQTMSFANNTTAQLWQGFMPRRKEIAQVVGTDMYSLQNYPEGFFNDFNPDVEFEKWAAVEVSGCSAIPEGMEVLELAGGLYAVFVYKGSPVAAAGFYRAIFEDWLPKSGYALDVRTHFEVLGAKYKNGAEDSEEEVWIPIKPLS
ncbi:MAG: GyrI-like domain-containing protein [Bacteroidota bacterium]